MPAPRIKRGDKPSTQPPRSSADTEQHPSGDVNAAVIKLLDAITALVEVVTTELERGER